MFPQPQNASPDPKTVIKALCKAYPTIYGLEQYFHYNPANNSIFLNSATGQIFCLMRMNANIIPPNLETQLNEAKKIFAQLGETYGKDCLVEHQGSGQYCYLHASGIQLTPGIIKYITEKDEARAYHELRYMFGEESEPQEEKPAEDHQSGPAPSSSP